MELGEKVLDPENELVIKRVIHTTADFEYADNLVFSPHAVGEGIRALKEGVRIITDTNMGMAGINKNALKHNKCTVTCFMSDEDVAEHAKLHHTTRACASMDKAAGLSEDCIFAVGNAPTALVRLYELIKEGKIHPRLIIGVPVGFVNVVQSKEMIMSLSDILYCGQGKKGRKQCGSGNRKCPALSDIAAVTWLIAHSFGHKDIPGRIFRGEEQHGII